MNIPRLMRDLERHEGKRTKPYKDSVGILTAGIGRNLQAVSFAPDEIRLMFENDIRRALETARKVVESFPFLDDDRQEVLINMAFNMGQATLSTFKRFIAAVNRGDFDMAANEMLDSKWAGQVGQRARELADRMRGQK